MERKGWKELKADVVDTDTCCLCGSCVAFCDNLAMSPAGPVEKEGMLCSDSATCRDGAGTCYNLCPMTGRDYLSTARLDTWVHGERGPDPANEFKHEITIVAARAGSGGGAVAGLLQAALREGIIDGVVFSSILGGNPELVDDEAGMVARAPDAPLAFAPLSTLGKVLASGKESVAIAGSGCEIQALRKLQNHPSIDFEVHELVSLALGTFCFFKPRPDRLRTFLEGKGIALQDVHHIEADATAFWHAIHHRGGVLRVPASELFQCSKGSCPSCMDGSASLADVSVGRVDALPGWDVVITRTTRGHEVLAAATRLGLVETKPLNPVLRDIVLEVTRNKLSSCTITGIEDVATGIKTFTFHAPAIARHVKPGQFVVLWIPDVDFLPMSVSGVTEEKLLVTVQRVGEGTAKLFEKIPGDSVGIRGPYGRGWNLAGDDFLLIGGGVGTAALTSARDELIRQGKRVTSLFGGRTRDHVFCTEDHDTCILTDDGSLGEQGLVTGAVERLVKEKGIKMILTCGPEPMMKKVHEIATRLGIEMQASLERVMKCCVGLCGTCTVGEDSDVPVCKHGPVFDKDALATFPQFSSGSK